jgi:hypothetical protein
MDSGVIPSTDPMCKHSIIFGKINLSVPPPPPYERVLWKYDLANSIEIKNCLNSINWNLLFENKNVNEMLDIFQSKFLEIANLFIPNKKVKINEKDALGLLHRSKQQLEEISVFLKNGLIVEASLLQKLM